MSDPRLPFVDLARLVKAAKVRKLISEGQNVKAQQLLDDIEGRWGRAPIPADVISLAARRLSTKRN